jgi:hypothetical protein
VFAEKGIVFNPVQAVEFSNGVNPIRNSSGGLNPAGIIIKPNPAIAEILKRYMILHLEPLLSDI